MNPLSGPRQQQQKQQQKQKTLRIKKQGNTLEFHSRLIEAAEVRFARASLQKPKKKFQSEPKHFLLEEAKLIPISNIASIFPYDSKIDTVMDHQHLLIAYGLTWFVQLCYLSYVGRKWYSSRKQKR